jgi:PAS domain-containing protein
MLRLERVWEARNRTLVLAAGGAIILAVAAVDWWTMPYVSLGFLYLFPIMLAAGFLPRWAVALLGAWCAVLAELFSALDRSYTRLSLETLALADCGLFVGELARNRRMTLEAQDRSRALVETSPAAIVTVDGNGFIELANLLAPRDQHLMGLRSRRFCLTCTTLGGLRRRPSSGHRCSARGTGETARRSRRTYGSRPTGRA